MQKRVDQGVLVVEQRGAGRGEVVQPLAEQALATAVMSWPLRVFRARGSAVIWAAAASVKLCICCSPWTVLADPDGNEFCVVRPKETLTG